MNNNESLFDAIFNKSSNSNYEYNDETIKYIYTNIFEKQIKNTSVHYGFLHTFNEHGYRSDSFNSNTEMLVTGCSYTFGSGIKTEHRWGNILSQNLKLPHSNLAIPGASVERIVRDLFCYFKTYGHPKYIFALFPIFHRMEIINNPKYFKTGDYDRAFKKMQTINSSNKRDVYRLTAHINDFPYNDKFYTQPLIAESVLPAEIPQFYSSMFIQMLEQYCELADITLIWSTWDKKQNMILEEVNAMYPGTYKNKINITKGRWEFDKKINKANYIENNSVVNCHEYYREKDNQTFDLAKDIEFGIDLAHWGTHRHLHVAEDFEKYFKEMTKNDI